MVSHGIIAALGGPAVFGGEPASTDEWVRRIDDGLPVACAIALKEVLRLTDAELASVLGIRPRKLAELHRANGRLHLTHCLLPQVTSIDTLSG